MSINFDDEHFKKLRELREKENLIRQERERILANRPWYSKPQNLISVLAIILPIIASIIFKVLDEDKKILRIEYNQSEKLLTTNELKEQRISVNYDSLNITNISSIKITITNTGDIPIRKSDFIDGPIKFNVLDKIQNRELQKFPFLLNVFRINDAGQQSSELKILERKRIGQFVYKPTLLNPGDKVEIGILLSNEPNVDLTWAGKIDNGQIEFHKNIINESQNIQINSTAKSILTIFKNKAISIPLTIAVFFILLIFNIGLWMMNADGEFNTEPAFIGFILLLGFSLFSIFTLTLFILLII